MSSLNDAIHDLHSIDALANRNIFINKLHPMVKVILIMSFMICVVSFYKYDVTGLAYMFIPLGVVFVVADLSWIHALKRLKYVMPFLILMGLFNPLFDTQLVRLGNIVVSTGVLSMLCLWMKGVACVLSAYVLVGTTRMDDIVYAFKKLHAPEILITVIMLTYRYLSLLMEEVSRVVTSYQLRAPKQNGIHYTAWGSLVGLVLLRSMDRAQVVYDSMLLRGYQGTVIYRTIDFTDKDGFFLIVGLLVVFGLRLLPMFIRLGGF